MQGTDTANVGGNDRGDAVRFGTPYRVGDQMYVNEIPSGARRRVRMDGPNIVLQKRVGKAAKKAAKKAKHRGAR